MRYSLYRLCNKYQWFTHGDCEQYDRVLSNAHNIPIDQLSAILWICSDDTEIDTIKQILTKELDGE